MRIFSVILLAPTVALAQASFPTEFPAGAVPFSSQALRERVAGKSFTVKPAAGKEYRIQYDEVRAYLDVGSFNDSGPWKIEGSSVCIEFTRAPSGCSEFRQAGAVTYTKRASNGEVVVMQPN